MTNKDPHHPIENDENSKNSPQTGGDSAGERQKTFSRRALLEAGWSVPLIAAVQFPTDSLAGVSVPAHQDAAGHSDTGPTQHSDSGGTAHVDTGGTPHADQPHSDEAQQHDDDERLAGNVAEDADDSG